MSAHRYTDCRIDCDYPDCGQSEFAGNLNTMAPTAANARTILQARGWKVGIPAPELGDRQRADYCPEHAGRIAREDSHP